MTAQSARRAAISRDMRSRPGLRSHILRSLAQSSSALRRAWLRPTPHTAVEMTRALKSQNDFHTRLEISHRTRDSHIPTAASLFSIIKTKTRTRAHAPVVP
jgi:hypothetical protein